MTEDREMVSGTAEGSMLEPDDAGDLDTAGGPDATRSPEKDPSDWVTGDEPMTGPQQSYLETLSREAGEDFDASLTKAQASERINELQSRTGRGQAS